MQTPEPTAASSRLRARIDKDRLDIERLTRRMPDDVRAPYFEDIDAGIAEYEALRDVEALLRRLVRSRTFSSLNGTNFDDARGLLDNLDEARRA